MRRASVLTAAVVLASASLSACQAATSVPSTEPPPPATTLATATTTTPPAPLLRVAVWGEGDDANWWSAFGGGGTQLDRALQQGATASMFSVTALDPVTDLAELPVGVPRPMGDEWVVEQEIGSRMWSDGTPLVAGDLVFYFETVRSLGLDGAHAAYFPPEITGIEAADDHTVRVRFSRVPGPSLWPGMVGLAPFVPAHFWAAEGLTDMPSLYAWKGSKPPRASEPRLEWVSAEGRESAYRMILEGGADFVHDPQGIVGLPPAITDALAADPAIEMVTSVRTELRVLAFNLRSAPLEDPAVRLALATLVDRDAMAEDLGVALADTFTRPSPSGETTRAAGPGSFDGERLDRAARIERATALLAGAGHDPGSIRPLEILVSSADPVRVAAAEAVVGSLSEFGLIVNLVSLSPEELADRVLPPIRSDLAAGWDLAILGWRPTGPDPGDLLIHLFGSAEDSVTRGGLNVSGYRSPAFDSLASRYAATTHAERAGSILDEMEVTLAADVPQLPLYRELVVEAIRDGLAFVPVAGGISANPSSWPYQEP